MNIIIVRFYRKSEGIHDTISYLFKEDLLGLEAAGLAERGGVRHCISQNVPLSPFGIIPCCLLVAG